MDYSINNMILRLALCSLFVLSLWGCSSDIPEETGNMEFTPTEPLITETILTEPVMPIQSETIPQEETKNNMMLINPRNTDFVNVQDYLPDIKLELKYGTSDNFTGQCIYTFEDCYLRYGTVQKLTFVCEDLQKLGLSLKIWDGFRPVSAQYALWEVFPDPAYVANPTVGFSSHSRGNTVDVTLVDSEGREVEMPTAFDDFSSLADRDYSDCTESAAGNASLLEEVMERHGFRGYWGEWWHFADTDSYDVETCFDPAVISLWCAHCEEFITLRTAPDTSAEEITRIPADETVILLGYVDSFALVEYRGQRGYVMAAYLRPAE